MSPAPDAMGKGDNRRWRTKKRRTDDAQQQKKVAYQDLRCAVAAPNRKKGRQQDVHAKSGASRVCLWDKKKAAWQVRFVPCDGLPCRNRLFFSFFFRSKDGACNRSREKCQTRGLHRARGLCSLLPSRATRRARLHADPPSRDFEKKRAHQKNAASDARKKSAKQSTRTKKGPVATTTKSEALISRPCTRPLGRLLSPSPHRPFFFEA